MLNNIFLIGKLITILVGLTTGGAVLAQEVGASAVEPEKHCVMEIHPIQPSQMASQMTEVGCFDTFSEAIRAATGGSVQLPLHLQPGEVTPQMLSTVQGNTIIGLDYAAASFGGSSYIWETAHTAGCSDGSSYGVASMPTGWNDVVSSAKSFAGCNHYYHYEHNNWTGAVKDCGGQCATMGTMDNRTSSEYWTP